MISPEVTHLKKNTMTAKATMTLTTSPIASVSVLRWLKLKLNVVNVERLCKGADHNRCFEHWLEPQHLVSRYSTSSVIFQVEWLMLFIYGELRTKGVKVEDKRKVDEIRWTS
jgi:hypothetical protein